MVGVDGGTVAADIGIVGVEMEVLGLIAAHNAHFEAVVGEGDVVGAIGIEDLEEIESGTLAVAISAGKGIAPADVVPVADGDGQAEAVVDALLGEGVLDRDYVLYDLVVAWKCRGKRMRMLVNCIPSMGHGIKER